MALLSEDMFMTESQNYRMYGLTFIGVLILAVYCNTFTHGFVWDDVDIIVDSPLFESFRNLPSFFVMEDSIDAPTGYYRPLTYVSFLIDRSIWGLNPLGFNITNLVLHIGTALAFYLLVAELFKKEFFAFIASLLFSLHPIANETVNFHAGGRNTLLCAFFALLSMLFHARRKFIAAVACFALALFSKEFALLIPAVFLFNDLCLSDTKPPLKSYALYGVALAGYLTLRSYAVASPNFLAKFDFANLLLLTPKLVIDYLSHMVYPLHLQTMYDIAPAERVRQTMPCILGIMGIFAATFFFRKKRELLFSTCWFFLFLLPVSGLLPTGLTAMADRYVYFSSMGFAMALAYLICLAPKKVAAVIAVPLCICYAGIDIQRNFYWKDQISLFTQMVKDVPELGVGYQNLGYLYYDKGDMDNAVRNLSIAYTKKAINPKMMLGSASIFWEAKQYDKAILALDIKTRFEPGDPLTYIMMSKIYGDKGDREKEKLYHDKALRISPQVDEMVRQRLDTLCTETDELLEKHDLAGAERRLKEAQKIDPNAVPVLVDSGVLAAEKGDYQKSLQYLTKALSLNPLYPPVHYNLSIVYQMMGNKADADKEMMKFREADAQAARKKNAPAEK
jgi:tetratricopeptide (TPR) repeat protein